jgi:hypothetical protein
MRNAWLAGIVVLAASASVFALGGDSNVGKDAPELQTKEWINSEGRTTFADMKGEVVLVVGWKTG